MQLSLSQFFALLRSFEEEYKHIEEVQAKSLRLKEEVKKLKKSDYAREGQRLNSRDATRSSASSKSPRLKRLIGSGEVEESMLNVSITTAKLTIFFLTAALRLNSYANV